MLALVACTTPLVDEQVLGADVVVETWTGAEGDELGGRVDRGGETVALARGANAVWVDGEAYAKEASAVGVFDGAAVYVQAGTVRTVADDVTIGAVSGAKHWAFGTAGIAYATTDAVGWLGGTSWPQAGVETLAVGEDTLYALVCADGCAVHAWGPEGARGAILAGESGGAIAEWDGTVWAGLPMLQDDDGAGRVCAADGRCVEGEVGDHLGTHLGGGFAAGAFNKWIVPARARLVPLSGGVVYAMEQGAETQPVTLAGDGDVLVVGAPYVAVGGAPAGIVQILRLP